jgi:hypothetical protein
MPKPRRNCLFNKDWLKDPQLKTWLMEAKSQTEAACKLCHISIDISNMGIAALRSHSNGKKHLQHASIASTSLGLTPYLSSATTSSPISSPRPVIECLSFGATQGVSLSPIQSAHSFHDKATHAEVIWTLHVVETHDTLRSCDPLPQLFKLMFPDSGVANQFSLGRDKAAYTIKYGLAPIFHKMLLSEVSKETHYSLSFDDSLNKITQTTQMDIQIRYWSSENRVSTRYLKSIFLQKTDASSLCSAFIDGTSGDLSLKNVSHVAMDGPNVNWAFLDKLKDHLDDDQRSPTLLETGSCSLHVVHGAMQTAHAKSDFGIKYVLTGLYYLFKDSPARRHQYFTLGSRNI